MGLAPEIRDQSVPNGSCNKPSIQIFLFGADVFHSFAYRGTNKYDAIFLDHPH